MKIRRRPYPKDGLPGAGKRGNVHNNTHRGKTGAATRGSLPNKPRKDK